RAQLRHADSSLALIVHTTHPKCVTGRPFAGSVTNAPGSRTFRRIRFAGVGRPPGPAGDLAGSSQASHERLRATAAVWVAQPAGQPGHGPAQPRSGGSESARRLERSVPWERGSADPRWWWRTRRGWWSA